MTDSDKLYAISELLLAALDALGLDLPTNEAMPDILMAYFDRIRALSPKTKSVVSAIFAHDVAESLHQKKKEKKGFGRIS